MESSEGSLLVRSVQETVRNDSESVPETYIVNPEMRPESPERGPISDQIPVIDFSLLAKGDEGERRKLDFAFQEWGCFQVINHGSDETLHRMKQAVARFFDLPFSEKKKYGKTTDDALHGYGQDTKVSDDIKRDWNDLLSLVTLPVESRKLQYWPLELPGFKEAIEEYAAEIQRMSDQILANLSLLMGLERDFLKQLHGYGRQYTRMNYYPACARPDLVIGLSQHFDNSSISLIMQENDVIGLHIKHEGVWLPLKPIPNAIAVLTGDALEAWSNGKYKALEHRVLTNIGKSRYSVASLLFPGYDVLMDPIETMVDDEVRPRMFRTGVTYGEHLDYTHTMEIEGKTFNNNDYLRIDRSAGQYVE